MIKRYQIFLIVIGILLNSTYAFEDEIITYRTTIQQKRKRTAVPISSKPKIFPLKAPEVSEFININTADIQTLQKIPLIGPKRAQAIIEYRESLPNKCFKSVEQLLSVKGISRSSFNRIRPYIKIDHLPQSNAV